MSKPKHSERAKYKKLAQEKHSKDDGPDQIWDIVNQQSLDCFGMLISCAACNGLMEDRETMSKMTTEQLGIVEPSAIKLAKATTRLSENIKAIRAQHTGLSGSSRDDGDYQKAFIIHNQYHQWYDDWKDTILPLLQNITDVFAEVTGKKIVLNPELESNQGAEAVLVLDKDQQTTTEATSIQLEAGEEPDVQFVHQEA
jgi:hypothetical protein